MSVPDSRGQLITGNAEETKTPDKEAIVLTPFTISADRDVGFVAASSLMGGRLAADLKDTAAAYTVLTREFIDALQLTDLSDANKWATNVSTANDDGATIITRTSDVYLSRGIQSNGTQRNFFPSNFSPDSYNLDRFDYTRGPNAVLFGTGGIGGTANTVTKQATLNKSAVAVANQVGSWELVRTTLDVNRPIGKSLAVRVNALYHDKGGWRQNDIDNRRGLTLSGTWKILNSLSATGEAEWGSKDTNVSFTTVLDRVSGWDGQTILAAPSRTGLPATTTGTLGNTTMPLIVSTQVNGDQPYDFGGFLTTLGGAETAGVRVGGMAVSSSSSPNIAGVQMLHAVNAPSFDARMANILNSPIVPQVTKDFFRDLGRHNTNFSHALDDPNTKHRYRTFTTSLNFNVGNLYLQAAGNYIRENFDLNFTSRNMNEVRLDLTKTLPSGQSNPGFLQPYSEAPYERALIGNETLNGRIAAAYVYKNNRIGELAFNFLAGSQRNTRTQKYVDYVITRFNSNPQNWGWNGNTVNGVRVSSVLYYRYYWTLNTPGRRSLPLPTAPFTWTVPGAGTFTGTPAWKYSSGINPSSGTRASNDREYLQASVKWAAWRKRIHMFAAGRRDFVNSSVLSAPPSSISPAYSDPNWDTITPPLRPAAPANYYDLSAADQMLYSVPPTIVARTTASGGIVVHATNWLREPLKNAQFFGE